MSTAFDTVEHSVLLRRFEQYLDISASAFDWCHSYCLDRTQSVNILGTSSINWLLFSGMPQGFVVGPFSFTSYTRLMGRICAKHGIAYHLYTDNSQLLLALCQRWGWGKMSTRGMHPSYYRVDANKLPQAQWCEDRVPGHWQQQRASASHQLHHSDWWWYDNSINCGK